MTIVSVAVFSGQNRKIGRIEAQATHPPANLGPFGAQEGLALGAAQAFPWAEGCAPADDLAGAGGFEPLLEHMDHSLVAGALLSQPKEHGFDHSYVAAAIKKHKKKQEAQGTRQQSSSSIKQQQQQQQDHQVQGIQYWQSIQIPVK